MSDPSDIAVINTNAIPEHLRQYQDDESAKDLVSGFASLPKLSIKGVQFTFKNEKGEETKFKKGQPIDLVILACDPPKDKLAKAYYSKGYTDDAMDSPDCTSSNGLFPDPYITDPISTRCVDCPKNQFNTAIGQDGTPGKGKACSDTKVAIVAHADNLKGPLAMLRIPATSLKSLTALGRHLAKHKIPLAGTVTQVGFADTTHVQLEFSPKSYLNKEDAAIAIERAASDDVKDAIPSINQGTDKPRELDTLPAPPSKDEVPAPPPEEQKTMMTDAAKNVSYDAYIAKGWTDELLIAKGLMIICE